MESQSDDTQPDLVDEIYKQWQQLCESRWGEDDTIAIDLDGDTITKLMETLADLSNSIVLHYIKLAVYQRTLEAKLDEGIPQPVGFTDRMPTT